MFDAGLDGGGAELDASAGTSGGLSAEEQERSYRARSLHIQNSLSGSTGLLHVSEAGSGAPGTFRFSLETSYFSGTGFLCDGDSPCPSIGGEPVTREDEIVVAGAHLGLSATVLPFLEAYVGFHNRASSDTRSRPQLLQVLGDTNLGVKAFMPREPNSIFSFGGELELWLLNGTGAVGLDGGGTSFGLRALSTVDLDNRLDAADRLPLRFHGNLGYFFDNSANLVEDLETQSPPNGRGRNITRIERFGLDINRVDRFEIGLAAEYVHDIVRPFLEWTIDIPVNRQGYVCNTDDAAAAGEGCLGENQGFSSTPSRLTLGARLFPWADQGLALTGAFDIGTGATGTFIDEVSPELPWNLWLGLAWAVDTVPPPPVVKVVEKPAPVAAAPARAHVRGTVVDRGEARTPIAGAVLRYDGRNYTGMVTGEDGSFETIDLDAGTYTFNVTAPGYRPGQCVASVPTPSASTAAASPAAPASPPATPAAPTGPGTPPVSTPGGVVSTVGGKTVVTIVCELEALPRVGNVSGQLTDGESGQPVGGARVKITDRLNRQLELTSDGAGAFRFENVPPGNVKISVEAPGYFASVTELSVKSREDVQARIVVNKRPTQPNVVVAGREVRLRKQVHFQHDSTEIMPDSFALLEEVADVFKTRPDIREAEIQGHTDNTGSAIYNQRLSQGRAQAVVDALVRLGVEPGRLIAKGYGADKPIAPNNSDDNRAKNRRVQILITEK